MTIDPILFWLWAYMSVGMMVYIGVNAYHPENITKKDVELGLAMIVIVFWPLAVVFALINIGEWAVQAVKKHRNREVVRLREEVEALKDKLYELEP